MKKLTYIIAIILSSVLGLLIAIVLIGALLWGLFIGVRGFLRIIHPTPLSSEEVVKQSKYCTENGMEPGKMISPLSGEIIRIQCQPN